MRQVGRSGVARGELSVVSRRAFTIIEIMIVLVIIGIIGGIVGFNLVGSADQARVRATEASMERVAGALTMYRGQYGRYPDTLDAIVQENLLTGGYPTDEWGSELLYFATDDGGYFMYSPGPNQLDDGGLAESDDIVQQPDHQ